MKGRIQRTFFLQSKLIVSFYNLVVSSEVSILIPTWAIPVINQLCDQSNRSDPNALVRDPLLTKYSQTYLDAY